MNVRDASAPEPAYLGILVCPKAGPVPFGSGAFYRRLAAAGRTLGLSVYVFALEWVDWRRRLVRGYAFDDVLARWRPGTFPLPRLVYDRAFPRTKEQLMRLRAGVARLAAQPGVSLLGCGLGGKLDVYRLLATEPKLESLLPPTEPYAGPASLARWLRERGDVVVKPQGGTHGKGVFRLRRTAASAFEARGRTASNGRLALRFASLDSLLRWADARLIGGRPFLLQPYLELTTREGAPFDVRALVQKNGEGRWTFTGAAARIGAVGGLTSNLHGGGTSRPAADVLRERFGAAKAERALRRIERAASAIPPVLERGHGPLLELGIDFGVDAAGQVWVLEVNSKPGRTSFTRLDDDHVGIAAVTSPIRYARYVLDRQLGGQNK
ncbi:YheC/YheD family protein [Paenibacillus sp.]|uniref:YheC/YheD family endospore coat-associated protein n=1 Tax=Paenibacillus sp. TaxID=58172 RepID=UPI002811E515|nr:YheC/YheD family protein [Paenibacillus sp.]